MSSEAVAEAALHCLGVDPADDVLVLSSDGQDSVLRLGVSVASTESFRWLDGGYFLVQAYETIFGDDPAPEGRHYWYCDSEAERFRIIFFSNNGPFTEEGNRQLGEVIGHRLTLEGPARFQYELDDEGPIKVNADGTISVAWWLRDENGQWGRG